MSHLGIVGLRRRRVSRRSEQRHFSISCNCDVGHVASYCNPIPIIFRPSPLGEPEGASLFTLHYYPLLLQAVHHEGYGMRQAYMSYVFGFTHGGELVQYVTAQYLQFAVAVSRRVGDGIAFAVVVNVDGEVTYSERCEVLEEVRALRWVNVMIWQYLLYYQSGSRDVRPLDRDAEPFV